MRRIAIIFCSFVFLIAPCSVSAVGTSTLGISYDQALSDFEGIFKLTNVGPGMDGLTCYTHKISDPLPGVLFLWGDKRDLSEVMLTIPFCTEHPKSVHEFSLVALQQLIWNCVPVWRNTPKALDWLTASLGRLCDRGTPVFLKGCSGFDNKRHIIRYVGRNHLELQMSLSFIYLNITRYKSEFPSEAPINLYEDRPSDR